MALPFPLATSLVLAAALTGCDGSSAGRRQWEACERSLPREPAWSETRALVHAVATRYDQVCGPRHARPCAPQALGYEAALRVQHAVRVREARKALDRPDAPDGCRDLPE